MTRLSALLMLAISAVTMWAAPKFNPTAPIEGTVRDTDGRPIAGVVMSDGFSVTVTDHNGRYAMTRTAQSEYIYYSLPADCEVTLFQGIPCFHKKLTYETEYNFVLQKRKKGAIKRFNLIFMADPQCQFTRHLRRFINETVPDLKQTAKRLKGPAYGVTLGDIAYSEGACNTTYLLPLMKGEMDAKKVGFPIFQTIGNHDHEYEPCAINERNQTTTIRLQRAFENVFGPTNYSWNCGDAHIVSMNDVIYQVLDNPAKYRGDFLDYQVEWLRQDLSHVSKDKLIFFCVHIPLFENLNTAPNVRKVFQLLSEFPNCRIMSGHTHHQRHFVYQNGMVEKVLGAASGCWWWSRCNGDGTPNGYAVTTIDGNRIVNHIYKGTGLSENVQMRLYRGNSKFGGEHEFFQLPYADDILLANVWNADPSWKIEVYEDGKLTGQMEPAKTQKNVDSYHAVEGNYKDWWAIGYNVGVVGRGHNGTSNRNNYCSSCHHMYKFKLHNKQAKIKVVATDSYGHRYTCSDIISTPDYSTDIPPVYEPSPLW